MLESYEDLAGNIGILSNRFRNYFSIVQKHGPTLRARLDDEGMTGKVHLWRKAPNYKREMMTLMRVARDPEEVKIFLGCYYALQVLQLHFLNINRLRREASYYKNRLRVYRQILTELRLHLKNLVSCYISSLVDLFSGNRKMNGIVICNVGMILDQDDLDVGVFIEPDIDRAFWNQVIWQVSKEYLKYSTKMHFYLAERVAQNSFLTTLDDYNHYIQKGINNYVLISELLLTEPLIGDSALSDKFQDRMIDQYYLDRGSLRLHEGYIRGMMGEIQDLTRFNISSNWVSPKNHALRLIHNLMNVLKTIYGVREHGSRSTLDILAAKNPEYASVYSVIQDAFSFIEMFFYVYQLTISVDDTFDSSESVDMDNLDLVANIMGLPKFGVVRPSLRLMSLYYENLEMLTDASTTLTEKIKRHLQKATIFNFVMKNEPPKDSNMEWNDNIAMNLAAFFKSYKDVSYWDDVLELLDRNNGELLLELVKSIEELPKKQQIHVFRRLLHMIIFDMDSMIMTGVLFSKYIREPRRQIYAIELKRWLTDELCSNRDRLKAFVDIVFSHPSESALYLLSLDGVQLIRLMNAVAIEPESTFAENARKVFLLLSRLLTFSSNNYRRLFARAVTKCPEIVTHIYDLDYLESISIQLYSDLDEAKNPSELKQKLSTYYQLSFCRCGISIFIRPDSPQVIYENYNSFFRRYFRWLYRACQWNVEDSGDFSYRFREVDEDDQPLAIFCAGGYAREEAFENDIDLIATCRDSDPKFISYAGKIINDMNLELLHESVMPQYRFAEITGSYITPISELDAFFSSRTESTFIELSQMLGSRLLVGSQQLNVHTNEILNKHIFSAPAIFIQDILEEIEDRRDYKPGITEKSVNVKEDPGALRDIQLIVTACQAHAKKKKPVMWKAFRDLENSIPELRTEFRVLERSYKFMRIFKDLHVLSLSDAENVMFEQLIDIFSTPNQARPDTQYMSSPGSRDKLLKSYRYYRSISQKATQTIISYMRKVYP